MYNYYLPGATVEDGGRTVKYTPQNVAADYSKAESFYKPILPGGCQLLLG